MMHIPAADPGPSTPADSATIVPDAHKLAVYHVAVAFQAASARLIPKGHAVLRDQLERASLSAVLNLAEGAGRSSRRDKARFYTIARYVELHITRPMCSAGLCGERHGLARGQGIRHIVDST
jgi:hypothetical protein